MFRRKNFACLAAFLVMGTQLSGMMIILDNQTVCGNTKKVMRGELSHIEGPGIGYNDGYSSLELFLAPIEPIVDDAWVPIIDLRGHVFNNAQFAGNVGLGARYLGKWIGGINLFYDVRGTRLKCYHQVGAGVELLGKVLDVRINAYLPIGDTQRLSSNEKRLQFALGGINAELGWKDNKVSNMPVYLAVGPYYFQGKNKSAFGVQGRLRVDFFHYLGVEGIISYDSLFDLNVQGQLSLTIPFGPRQKIKKRSGFSCERSKVQRRIVLEPIQRNEIIVLDKKQVHKKSENEMQMEKVLAMKLSLWEAREAFVENQYGE